MTVAGNPEQLPANQDPRGEDLVDRPTNGDSAPDGRVEPPPNADHVTPTRISASWTAVVAAVFILIVLVIFIAENTQRSTVNFLGFHGHAPTAVVLLIAAIGGALIVIIVGLARIIQLRKVAKHSETVTASAKSPPN
jgi:uncharacterized integral membrane protein